MAEDYTINPFLVDAGMLYVGTTPIGWGPFRGALKFDPGITMRYPEWNGVGTPIDGTPRITSYNSVITGQLGDKSALSLSRLYPGSTSDGSSGNNVIRPINAREFISTNDTLADVLLVHRGSDGNPIGHWFKKAIVDAWDLVAEDNNEGLRNITIRALLAADADRNAPPFREISPFDFDTFAFAGW